MVTDAVASLQLTIPTARSRGPIALEENDSLAGRLRACPEFIRFRQGPVSVKAGVGTVAEIILGSRVPRLQVKVYPNILTIILVEARWAFTHGHPHLLLGHPGNRIAVWNLARSENLPMHWREFRMRLRVGSPGGGTSRENAKGNTRNQPKGFHARSIRSISGKVEKARRKD